MTDKNSHLGQRVEELIAERDSALHDSQELLNGMQVRIENYLNQFN